ncbi:hypothetical protein EMIHUDRAFT_206725 [Emiliania huxleyi CCMP1516]|uniref:Large ribosomal subunit protein uL24 C-terminal domain-containing protein n=2 Tax=Emiliania huxleyi TaxID=2903 RepID=A0A0D3JMC4_EMIH1|nr:hypothetical protein EMIHUDRAFT_206725 [Emiliania huxleyi CCMP1516]EOD24659.1 hypothetical protein EMIHUDRAFT_206725 [Emiliania huxleyi CCMP1516]|eukprot:XP_005777088.1 hypothetical protein EMIHUDRAFT_206725 [Emiliania huxleyi CCMP1516]
MLLRPPAVTPAPPIAGASRQRSQKQSNKLRQKRMAHPRRSKRDAMARRGIKPQQPLPDWKWGIFARDEVAVYHGKRKMGQGKVLRVDHARSRVWVEGIKLREFATEESANDPDPSRPLEYELREDSVHYSQCNLIDPVDGRRTRLRWRYLPDGRRVRVAVRSGALLPRVPPPPPDEPREFPRWSERLTTPRDAVLERTNIAPQWAKQRV